MNAFLRGELVWLRPVEEQDVPTIADWYHDREVTEHLSRGTFPVYSSVALDEHRSMVASDRDFEFAICLRESDEFVGITGLHSIEWIARSAEFRIVLGEKDHWGKGIGTEVVQLLCAYAFELLNLHKVWLGVNSDNRGAMRSYEKAGFTLEGELRDEIFRNGRYHHATRMSMLEDEYRRQRDSWSISRKLNEQFPRLH